MKLFFLIIGTFVLLLGVAMKIMHWPYSHGVLISASGMLLMSFVLHYFIKEAPVSNDILDQETQGDV